MCGAGLLFPVMSGFAKFLGEDGYSSLQISWARAFGHIVYMLIVFVPRFGTQMLRTRRPRHAALSLARCCSSPTPSSFSPDHLHSARQGRVDHHDGAVLRAADRLAVAGRAHDARPADGDGGWLLRRAAGDPARHRAVPMGLAALAAERSLLCGLPGADAPDLDHRTARDLELLQLDRGRHRHVRSSCRSSGGRRRPCATSSTSAAWA